MLHEEPRIAVEACLSNRSESEHSEQSVLAGGVAGF